MPTSAPHISLVATSRNDNHGGSMLYRMQHFIDGYVHQFNKFKIPSELIIVDWNPPPENPPLSEALKIPAQLGCCEIRFITFPAELHHALPHGAELPLFQMIAKNIGIRRARGQLVAATNIDILFSDAIMRELKKPLPPGVLYRADRFDVPHELPEAGYDEILKFCARETFRKNLMDGTYTKTADRWLMTQPIGKIVLTPEGVMPDYSLRTYAHAIKSQLQRINLSLLQNLIARLRAACHLRHPGASGTSIRLSDYYFLFKPTFWKNHLSRPAHCARNFLSGLKKLLQITGEIFLKLFRKSWQIFQYLIRSIYVVVKEFFDLARSLIKLALMLGQGIIASFKKRNVILRLHTNACGDFTMLTREDWDKIRGYAEWPIFSWNLDSVLLYQAFFNNISEKLLAGAPVYHIEHGKGSGYTPEGAETLFKRIEAKGIPYMDWPGFLDEIKKMHQSHQQQQPVTYCDENWGYADVELPEVIFADPR